MQWQCSRVKRKIPRVYWNPALRNAALPSAATWRPVHSTISHVSDIWGAITIAVGDGCGRNWNKRSCGAQIKRSIHQDMSRAGRRASDHADGTTWRAPLPLDRECRGSRNEKKFRELVHYNLLANRVTCLRSSDILLNWNVFAPSGNIVSHRFTMQMSRSYIYCYSFLLIRNFFKHTRDTSS